MDSGYKFNISLSVLNHLGRNLYRNFITILGEAISNSWDADANNVWINIDRDNNYMKIYDDGVGMTSDDFQNKFLKIGYSKRQGKNYKTPSGRPFIGRKGIGKLALLSCSKKVIVASKTNRNELVGGIIDNAALDEAISDDIEVNSYTLQSINNENFKKIINNDDFINLDSGTYIYFQDLNEGIKNTVDYLRKLIALYFRFSLIDDNFNIFVNCSKVTLQELKDLADNTQFVWEINSIDDPYLQLLKPDKYMVKTTENLKIKGYIASVKKPSKLKIRGSEEKVTLDLFVNGRLREKDIMKHIPTSRLVENYLYGQIHFDGLDTGTGKEVFTTSRESVIDNDPDYREFLDEISRLLSQIIQEWDEFRRELRQDGDPDNESISKTERKSQELLNATFEEMEERNLYSGRSFKKNGIVDNWVSELSKESRFNIPLYTECFISENLLRNYIQFKNLEIEEKWINKAKNFKKIENDNKEKGNYNFDIRKKSDNVYYFGMDTLAEIIDKKKKGQNNLASLCRSSIFYKPVRDAVAHTSMITDDAKDRFSSEFKNIEARIIKLMDEVE